MAVAVLIAIPIADYYLGPIAVEDFLHELLLNSYIIFGIFGGLLIILSVNSIINLRKISQNYALNKNAEISSKKAKNFATRVLILKILSMGILITLLISLIGIINLINSNYFIIRSAIGYALTFVLISLLIGSFILSLLLLSQFQINFIRKKGILKLSSNKKLKLIASPEFRAICFIFILLFTAIGVPIIESLKEPRCNPDALGFNEPAYSLENVQNNPHYNELLDDDVLINQTILQTLEKGLWAMTQLQSMGGFPMYTLQDGSERYGDTGTGFPFCNYFPGEFSLQGGTQLVGYSYLNMYQLESNPVYLNVALEAANALIAVQNEGNGGFEYNGRIYPDGTTYPGRILILDDDVTQANLP